MTAEETASDLVRLVLSATNNREAEAPVTAALTLARAEGRREGLEEAAGEVRRIEEEVEDGEDVVNLCDELERRIRALADGPKAT